MAKIMQQVTPFHKNAMLRGQIKSSIMAKAEIFSASGLKFFWNTYLWMPKKHKS